MKIKPFNTLVLVEKLIEEKKSGHFILPDAKGDYFIKAKVLAVGDLVTKINVGSTIICHDLVEVIEAASKIGFITESHIFGEVENDL
jgi:co-chaperonin GroES (HSP10)